MEKKTTLAQGQELTKLVLQSGIDKDSFQLLLESGKFTTLLKEFMVNTMTRSVRVDRTRTPQEAINATNRAKYTNDLAVESMPAQGKGVEPDVEVTFFHLGRFATDDEVAAEFETRGLKPDPYAVAAANEADPSLADVYPNGTHWKNADGNWCFVAFDRDGDERHVSVDRHDRGWRADWWFGGVPKRR
jgi:hypothetical protein